MKREDTISLLKELMGTCPTFCEAQAVSVMAEKDGWSLSVFWVPRSSDGDCLERIVAKRGLEVAAIEGRTIFRSR